MAASIKKDFANNRSRKPDISPLIYGKVPPQAPDLEEAVLGAILLEKEGQDIAFETIRDASVFYVDAHQKIYQAIQSIYSSGGAVDLLTVTEQLRRADELELIGGAYYLTKLTMSVLSSAHIEYHCQIILEKYMQREIIRIAGAAMTDAYEDSTDVFDLLDKIDTETAAITAQIIRHEPEALSKGIVNTLKEIEEQSESKLNYTGVPTGFKELNEKTSGWQKTNVIVLAARPSVGKTAFAINLAMNAAKEGFPVAFFSLEMSKGEIHRRMLANISGVECDQINNPNRMTADEKKLVANAAMKLSKLSIFIDDTAGMNCLELRAKARKLKRKHDIQIIVIDYLQLMTSVERNMNREQVVATNSREIKKLAKDLDVAVIPLSQLNRGVENDKNRLPGLGDLRESGAIEQDADIVMFLSNPTPQIVNEMPIFSGKILLHLAKGRNIGLGNIPLEFNKSIQLFKDVNRLGDAWRSNTQEPQKPFAGFQNYNPNQTIEPKKKDESDDLPF